MWRQCGLGSAEGLEESLGRFGVLGMQPPGRWMLEYCAKGLVDDAVVLLQRSNGLCKPAC